MNRLLDALAEFSALRERESLDTMVGEILFDLLPQVKQVCVAVPVGEEGDQRWLRRSVLSRNGEPRRQADAPWVQPDALPPLSSELAWQQCLQRQDTVEPASNEGVTLLPLLTDMGIAGVVELVADPPLSSQVLHGATAVLRIYRNMVGMLDYSERDTLTGLLNRKSFDETFLRATVVEANRLYGDLGDVDGEHSREGERRSVRAMPRWLGVLDIDHFKLVNDVHGHLIGDEVLLLVARIMRNTFRYGDKLYRFGGEEFVVLLAAPDESAAKAAFERLRRNIADYAFPRVGHVTVSVGFSDVRAGDTPQAAFERADRAVYHGKHNGRNQVHSFGALVGTGELIDDSTSGDVELF